MDKLDLRLDGDTVSADGWNMLSRDCGLFNDWVDVLFDGVGEATGNDVSFNENIERSSPFHWSPHSWSFCSVCSIRNSL